MLNIPSCYRGCLCEDDHHDKVDALKVEYCYNISKMKDEFVYPSIKDRLDDDVIEGDEHNSQFQIGIVLYDGDDLNGQISILDQSWSYIG